MDNKFYSYLGDCFKDIKKIESSSVDLVITSPPYADARKKQYGGPPPDEYVEWFLPLSAEIKRVLKPTGTFILNIKEKVVNCERHTYVLELILAMRKQGWLWTEEWIWHKKTCVPGKWPNRFRDAWERCLQFNLQTKFKMNQDAVMVPMGDWKEERLKNLSENDKIRMESKTGSQFSKKILNWVGKDMAYPTNVLHMAAVCNNKQHPASYPEGIPEFFIKLFTDENDIVLDPFQGGGTTGIVAMKLKRIYIGMEKNEKYWSVATGYIEQTRYESESKAKLSKIF